MKNLILILFCLIAVVSLSAQFACPDDSDGIPINDRFPGCDLCVNPYFGTTGGYTVDFLNFDFPCDDVDGNQWFTVIADPTGSVSATISTGPCFTVGGHGAEAIFYDFNLQPVSTCLDLCGNNQTDGQLIANNLIPSEQYLLMIDQCAPGDSCMLVLQVNNQKLTSELQTGAIDVLPEQRFFCTPNEACYSIASLPSNPDYIWEIGPEMQILEGGSLTDTFVRVQFLEQGFFDIKVTPAISCRLGRGSTLRAFVRTKINNLSAVICPGETYKVGSEIFEIPGDYTVLFENQPPTNCDSTVFLNLKIPDTSFVKIQCVRDTFLGQLAISWDKKTLADEYQIFINDSLVNIQTFIGYNYQPNFSNEKINVKVKPIGTHGCDYATKTTPCTGPILTNSQEVFKSDAISVFPNPSSGIFEIFSKSKIEKIEVFDLSGRKQKEVFALKINLSELEAGVYFLRIYTAESSILRKVIRL